MLSIGIMAPGCVRRRLTVRTNPPGASVYVDKQMIGTSPASTYVTYYGTREIEVVADGYRTERILRTFTPPWYQIPPLDFISESLWPREVRDERVVDITMIPSQREAPEIVLARAEGLRLQAQQQLVTPLPPTVGSGGRFGQIPGVPGAGLPQPIDPGFQSGAAPPIVSSPENYQGPIWQPGQALRDLVFPGGQAPTRIPETGILPGGGYRPPVP